MKPHDHYHHHPWGEAHEHKHDSGHHGPAFGKTSTVFVGDVKDKILVEGEEMLVEPDLSLLLKRSIEREEAKRDASTT